jgi:hypothetical protein
VEQIHLELRADPGEGAPELVAGVGDEPVLPLRRVVEAGEHRVHGAGEPSDLVARRRFRHATMEVLRADRLHLGADRLHRAQRPAGQDPRGRADEQQQERQADEQEVSEAVGAVGHRVEAAGDVDGVDVVLRADATGDDAKLAVACG